MKPLILAAALIVTLAMAHDKWGNGEPVQPWVKTQCRGPQDAHQIPASAITIRPDGYHIEGLTTVVPFSKAFPSPDANYWGFWRPDAEPNPVIFCLFVPMSGS